MIVRRVCFVAGASLLVVSACGDTDSSETSSSSAVAVESQTSTTTAVATTVPEPPATTTTIATTTIASAMLDTSQAPQNLTELDAAVAAIRALPSADAPGAAATLYETLVDAGQVPFIDGAEVGFLYHGEGDEVTVLANFNWFGLYGNEPLPLVEVGDTSLWWASIALPSDARIQYRLIIDGDRIADPAHENTTMTAADSVDSVLAMPDYAVTDFSQPGDGPTGTLTDVALVTSEAMGYDIAYQVYMPHGYDVLDQLPVLYVTDGSDFSHPQLGAMPVVLDNLIAADTIEPVMAVFIDAWDPDRVTNRREIEFHERPEDYARFVTTELVPLIDATYRTDPRSESRVIVGLSSGAVGAIYISVLQPGTFDNLALFSLALATMFPDFHSDPARADTAARMFEIVNASADCPDGDCESDTRIFSSAGIPEWDVGDLSPVYESWDAAGIDYQIVDVQDGHTFGHWAGVTDEMLEFFFATA